MKKIALFKSLLDQSDYRLITKSLKSGWLTHGKNNLIFEENFSKLIGCKYSITMNSCTSALECSLKILQKKGLICVVFAMGNKIYSIIDIRFLLHLHI